MCLARAAHLGRMPRPVELDTDIAPRSVSESEAITDLPPAPAGTGAK